MSMFSSLAAKWKPNAASCSKTGSLSRLLDRFGDLWFIAEADFNFQGRIVFLQKTQQYQITSLTFSSFTFYEGKSVFLLSVFIPSI